jgi:HD-GYP domain-containing protein (c-di-GMP phosphodiesterase class II)
MAISAVETVQLPAAARKQNGGVQVAERIRQNVADWVFFTNDGAEVRLTVSVGMCSYSAEGAAAPDLVEVAGKALGFAKSLGGNQIQLYRELPTREAPDNVVSLPHSGREAIVRSLAAAVDVRDGYTHTHSNLVSELSAAVARRFGLPASEVGRVRVGALLHDVGKIGIPDAILTKAGGLSPEEWEFIQQHPVLGKQILEQAPELTDISPLVLHHQERFDGTGYPGKLAGDDIPLGARIIAAADAYHAIISDRPYRSRRSHSDAVRELSRCSGAQFDPSVVHNLLTVLATDEKIRSLLPVDDSPSEFDAAPVPDSAIAASAAPHAGAIGQRGA